NGLVAVDQPEKGLGDPLQLLRPGLGGELEEQVDRQQVLALGLDRLHEQGVLVLEVAVDGELGHSRGLGDGIHAGALVAALGEQGLGRIEDGGALLQVLRTAWRGRGSSGSGHARYYY